MFERFNQGARRALFVARYEAFQHGSLSIETDHLLLGLIQEPPGVMSLVFARTRLPLEIIRQEIEKGMRLNTGREGVVQARNEEPDADAPS